MRDIATKFGENAGKIWMALNEKGCLKKEKILEITNLEENDFNAGVGWLARENKISRDDKECYKLDATNLVSDLGRKAGRIWKILDIWGDADYITIKKLSDLGDEEIYVALGWLSREDKIWVDGKQRFNLK